MAIRTRTSGNVASSTATDDQPTAIVYARKTTGEAEAVDRQLQRLDSIAAATIGPLRTPASIIGRFRDDGITAAADARGRFKHRAGFEAALDAVREHRPTYFACTELSRLMRDPSIASQVLVTCIEAGTVLLDESKTSDPADADDAFHIDLTTALSAREVRMTRQRIKRDRARARANGELSGRLRRFGYEPFREPMPPNAASGRGERGKTVRSEWLANNPAVLRVRESEAEPLREAARRIVHGASWGSVVRWLNTSGVRTFHGAYWATSRLQDVLTRAINCGWIEHNGELIRPAANVESTIFDRETLDAIIARIEADRNRTHGRPSKPTQTHFAGGLLYCAGCGRRMQAYWRRTGYKTPSLGYRCPPQPTGVANPCPFGCVISARVAHTIIRGVVVNLLASEDYMAQAGRVADRDRAEYAALAEQYRTVDDEITQLANGPGGRYVERRAHKLEADLADIERRMESLAPSNDEAVERIQARVLSEIEQKWDADTTTPEERRAFALSVVRGFVVNPVPEHQRGTHATVERVRTVLLHESLPAPMTSNSGPDPA